MTVGVPTLARMRQVGSSPTFDWQAAVGFNELLLRLTMPEEQVDAMIRERGKERPAPLALWLNRD